MSGEGVQYPELDAKEALLIDPNSKIESMNRVNP
jgi:hypothetical protein